MKFYNAAFQKTLSVCLVGPEVEISGLAGVAWGLGFCRIQQTWAIDASIRWEPFWAFEPIPKLLFFTLFVFVFVRAPFTKCRYGLFSMRGTEWVFMMGLLGNCLCNVVVFLGRAWSRGCLGNQFISAKKKTYYICKCLIYI